MITDKTLLELLPDLMPRGLAYLRSRYPEASDADLQDCVQSVAERIIRHHADKRPPKPFGYFCTACQNARIDQVRGRGPEYPVDHLPVTLVAPDHANEVEARLDRQSLVDTLPLREQATYVGAALGLSLSEQGRFLGVSKTEAGRNRKRLRRVLEAA